MPCAFLSPKIDEAPQLSAVSQPACAAAAVPRVLAGPAGLPPPQDAASKGADARSPAPAPMLLGSTMPMVHAEAGAATEDANEYSPRNSVWRRYFSPALDGHLPVATKADSTPQSQLHAAPEGKQAQSVLVAE